jgi:DNA-binding ferritin-like protein
METLRAATPDGELLRVPFTAHGLKVDREKKIIFGLPLAQQGDFKSEGRGSFDLKSLQLVLSMAQAAPRGLKSRLAHPDESNDGIDKTLGRFQDPRLGTVADRESDGTLKVDTVPAVLADLHFNAAASKGAFDMADYLMTMAETDSALFSTSLVLQTEKEPRRNTDGTPMLGPDGEELPPLWRPTKLMACDVVSTGDACDGILARAGGSLEALAGLPNGVVFAAQAALDKQFSGKPRAFVEGHCQSFLRRYLDRRYGSLAPAASPQAALSDVLAILQAQRWLYHTLHWQAAGPNFAGQHALFERLYSSLPEQYDALAEKLVAASGAEAVEPVGAILASAGHLAKWQGDPMSAGLASEADLSAAILVALNETAADAGMTNFLQGLADEHQTNVYLLQQVQGGKKPEEAMASRPNLGDGCLTIRKLVGVGFSHDLAIAIMAAMVGRLLSDANDSEPNNPTDPAGDESLHDGCRSTLAYHHQTLCRLCGGTIAACGCQNVAKESRVVTMAKEPCLACQKLAMGEDAGAAGGATVPADNVPDADLAKAALFVLTEL